MRVLSARERALAKEVAKAQARCARCERNAASASAGDDEWRAAATRELRDARDAREADERALESLQDEVRVLKRRALLADHALNERRALHSSHVKRIRELESSHAKYIRHARRNPRQDLAPLAASPRPAADATPQRVPNSMLRAVHSFQKGLVSPADLFTPAVFVTSAAARSARPSPQIAKALGRTFTPRQSPRASPRGSPRSSADAPRDY